MFTIEHAAGFGSDLYFMNNTAVAAYENLLKTRYEKTITFSCEIVRRIKRRLFIPQLEIQEKTLFFIIRRRRPKTEYFVDNSGVSKRG